VETVYRAITEPAQIAQWFSDAAELDLAPGGESRLTFDDRATSLRMAVRLRVQAADAALPARRAAGSRVPPGPQRRNLAGSTVVDRRATPRFKRRPGAVACAPAPLYADHRVLADELVAFPGGATAARYLRARRRQFDEGGLGADEHRLMLTVIALREIRQSLLDAGASRLSTRRTGARPGAGPGSHTGRTRTPPMRHYYASVLLAGGVDINTLSEYLGHKDAAITLRVYSHLLPSAGQRVLRVIDEALAAADSGLEPVQAAEQSPQPG
jgi:integrase